MRTVLSPEQMRALEARYMKDAGVASIDLMERAAQAVADVIRDRLGACEGHTVCFACGPGGNGGDGFAAARLFAQRGGRAVVVCAAGEASLSGDARTNCLRARETPRVFFHDVEALDALKPPDMWVDALFGIGLNKPLHGPALRLARRMAADREAGAPVLAVDIPSGICGQSGADLGGAVMADITVSFQHRKLGQLLLDGFEACGELLVLPIGIDARPEAPTLQVELADLRALIPPRRRNTHKGDYGHLLIVAGSLGMAGACVLAASAAISSGAGLVTVACPASIVPIVQVRVPCAMCAALPEEGGAASDAAADIIRDILPGKTALVIGPGLSTRASARLLEAALNSGLPAVIDADALNLVAQSPALRALLRANQIITPHPGEARRLLGRDMTDPVCDAVALRRLGPVALLKGATSVIAGARIHLSLSGSPGMARGGSGDVLTGILGALLARGLDPEAASCLGSELHGRAGESAACREGVESMTAEDIISGLKEAFKLVW